MPARGPRIFLSHTYPAPLAEQGKIISLPRDQGHYVRDVLRLDIGDGLELGDPDSGIVLDTKINNIRPDVTVEVLGEVRPSVTKSRHITLLCALLKGEKNEQVCDWATELGCREIHFWQSSRSIVRLRDEGDLTKKSERLNKIALAAAQQSRQPRPPCVSVHKDLTSVLAKFPSAQGTLHLIASLAADTTPIQEVLTGKPDCPVVVVVGPEGDLSPEEHQTLIGRCSYIPVSLGESTLRSELAVVAALCAIRNG